MFSLGEIRISRRRFTNDARIRLKKYLEYVERYKYKKTFRKENNGLFYSDAIEDIVFINDMLDGIDCVCTYYSRYCRRSYIEQYNDDGLDKSVKKALDFLPKIFKVNQRHPLFYFKYLVIAVYYLLLKNNVLLKFACNFTPKNCTYLDVLRSSRYCRKHSSDFDTLFLRKVEILLCSEDLVDYGHGKEGYKFLAPWWVLYEYEKRLKREKEWELKRLEEEKIRASMTYLDWEYEYLENRRLKQVSIINELLYQSKQEKREQFYKDYGISAESWHSFKQKKYMYFYRIEEIIKEKSPLYNVLFRNRTAYCVKENEKSHVKYIVTQPKRNDFKNITNLVSLLEQEKGFIAFCFQWGHDFEIFLDGRFGNKPLKYSIVDGWDFDHVFVVFTLLSADLDRKEMQVIIHDVDRDIVHTFYRQDF